LKTETTIIDDDGHSKTTMFCPMSFSNTSTSLRYLSIYASFSLHFIPETYHNYGPMVQNQEKVS